MADVVGIKISQLESTTDLQDLYTIGTDKNNSSKKVKLQFLKEAADYANSQGDYAKGVADNSAGNIGVSDYPAFSESGSYASGDVVNYNGKLYRFTAPHQSGAWNGNDVVPTSINAESQRKLTELESEIQNIVLESGGLAIVDSVEKLNALDAPLGSIASLVLTREEIDGVTLPIEKRVSVDLYIKSVLGWQPMAKVSQINDAITKAIESTLNTEV